VLRAMGKVQLTAKKTMKKDAGAASTGSVIPSASELGGAIVGGSPVRAARGGPDGATAGGDGDSTLHVYVMDFCDDGNVYGTQFEGKMKALHCIYDIYPSVLYSCFASLAKYAQECHAADNAEPQDMTALEIQYGMKMVATNEKDLDQVKTYKKNRVVFYVDAANVKPLCCYLDGWVAWRLQNPISANDPPMADSVHIEFHVPLDSSLEFVKEDAMENKCTIVKEKFDSVDVFQGHPPAFPTRPVVASIEAESRTFVSIVFAGNTKPFASLFDLAGIGRKKGTPLPGETYAEWYRVMTRKSIAEKDGIDEIAKIFGNEVLQNSPVFIRLKKLPEQDDRFSLLLETLKALPRVRILS
jgi:hypothetical protein